LALPWIGIGTAYLLLGHNATSRLFATFNFVVAMGWFVRGLWDRTRFPSH
jgi:hypothetical protein